MLICLYLGIPTIFLTIWLVGSHIYYSVAKPPVKIARPLPDRLRQILQSVQGARSNNISLFFPLLQAILSLCVLALILSELLRWVSLPVDILLYFLGNMGDSRTIGRIEGFTYKLLSKEFSPELAKGNDNMVG